MDVSDQSHITILGNGATVQESDGMYHNYNTQSLIYYNGLINGHHDTSPTIEISDVTFTGFNSYNGGVIHVVGSCNLTLTSVQFTNNSASDAGGVIYVAHNQYSTLIHNCSFISCHASSSGGAMSLDESNRNVRIIDSMFSDGTAGSGGCIHFGEDNEEIVVANCMFKRCYATHNGGAIYVAVSNVDLVFRSDSFLSNSASYGGALSISEQNRELNITSSRFTSNVATVYGGAIYADHMNTLIMRDMDIGGNRGNSGTCIKSIFHFFKI